MLTEQAKGINPAAHEVDFHAGFHTSVNDRTGLSISVADDGRVHIETAPTTDGGEVQMKALAAFIREVGGEGAQLNLPDRTKTNGLRTPLFSSSIDVPPQVFAKIMPYIEKSFQVSDIEAFIKKMGASFSAREVFNGMLTGQGKTAFDRGVSIRVDSDSGPRFDASPLDPNRHVYIETASSPAGKQAMMDLSKLINDRGGHVLGAFVGRPYPGAQTDVVALKVRFDDFQKIMPLLEKSVEAARQEYTKPYSAPQPGSGTNDAELCAVFKRLGVETPSCK
jgi:hypothetical protein